MSADLTMGSCDQSIWSKNGLLCSLEKCYIYSGQQTIQKIIYENRKKICDLLAWHSSVKHLLIAIWLFFSKQNNKTTKKVSQYLCQAMCKQNKQTKNRTCRRQSLKIYRIGGRIKTKVNESSNEQAAYV